MANKRVSAKGGKTKSTKCKKYDKIEFAATFSEFDVPVKQQCISILMSEDGTQKGYIQSKRAKNGDYFQVCWMNGVVEFIPHKLLRMAYKVDNAEVWVFI